MTFPQQVFAYFDDRSAACDIGFAAASHPYEYIKRAKEKQPHRRRKLRRRLRCSTQRPGPTRAMASDWMSLD
jgi:hypothetical protein